MIGLRFPLLPENHTHLHLHLHHHHTNAHHIHHCALPFYVLPYYPIHSAYARTCKIIVNPTSGSSLLAVNWLCALVKIPEANKKISRDMLVLVLSMTFPSPPQVFSPNVRPAFSPPLCINGPPREDTSRGCRRIVAFRTRIHRRRVTSGGKIVNQSYHRDTTVLLLGVSSSILHAARNIYFNPSLPLLFDSFLFFLSSFSFFFSTSKISQQNIHILLQTIRYQASLPIFLFYLKPPIQQDLF